MIHDGVAHVPLRLCRPLNLTDADMTDAAQIERARLNVTLTLYAIARLVEAQATGDARFFVAADAIKQIADTMDRISDDTVLRIASAKTISEGLLSRMFTSRLAAIGFAVPRCANAAEFFQPLVEQANVILHRARPRLHRRIRTAGGCFADSAVVILTTAMSGCARLGMKQRRCSGHYRMTR